jgi:phage N-6-adenine-methyltransferase
MNALLPGLVAQIEAEHQAAIGAAQSAIERAIACGQLLIQAKSEVGHGGWQLWVEEHLSFGARQASKYMRLAAGAQELANRNCGSDLGVNEALKLLTDGHNVRTTLSGNDAWFTPPEYIGRARRVLGQIDLDPASCALAQATVQAARYFTEDDDGLSQPWHGKIFCNPPYARIEIGRFVGKLADEFQNGNVEQAILLTHSASDTAWFSRAVSIASALCFPRGRINFYGSQGTSPIGASVFFYIGNSAQRFAQEFGEVGSIMVPWPGARP